ncbi:MAG TPA: UbiH/UbiF family hydroxylase [Burkholderiales bacterium]|nr:UbiH/UbiF family hydroxylase [Burkholderiales bacterium]
MDSSDFDLTIVGGGLVGLSLARALRRSGLRLALVERSDLLAEAETEPDAWDARMYAISPASEAFLRELHAWPAVEDRLAPVTQMRIYGDQRGSELAFSAYDAHVSKLATIVENAALMAGLRGTLRHQPDLTLFSPGRCAEVLWEGDHAMLQLEGGAALRSKLLVAADGADSWLRRHAGLAVRETEYGQTAVVANFAAALPHRGAAFQWFRPDGVLALLPLPGNRASMVWSARKDMADDLLGLAPDALCAAVEQACGAALGHLTLITKPAGFALRLIRVPRLIGPRLALVGDAAHNLHPLAGQGVNLGFQDARELTAVLAARGHETDVGSRALLRCYERARREDIVAMTAVTHGLQRLFNNSAAPLAWLRNLGLSLTDHVLPLKALLIKHALG